MLLYATDKSRPQAPTAPDGAVVSPMVAAVSASKSVTDNIIYQVGGEVYRYTNGQFYPDSTAPTAIPDVLASFSFTSPLGRNVSGYFYNFYGSSQGNVNVHSTFDQGVWTSTGDVNSVVANRTAFALDDDLVLETTDESPPVLYRRSDGGASSVTLLTTTAFTTDARASLDRQVIALGSHYVPAWLFVKNGTTWSSFDTGCSAGYNAGIDITGDGTLAVVPDDSTPGTRVFSRSGATWTLLATLPFHKAVGISNDGRVIVGCSPGQAASFYRRTAPATWERYRTTKEVAAFLVNESCSCTVDPSGTFAVVTTSAGAVFYHTNV